MERQCVNKEAGPFAYKHDSTLWSWNGFESLSYHGQGILFDDDDVFSKKKVLH